ncbi:hypothetical protein QJQ45_003869 [Haematococcus lacustris]|nr:hypothetical protein QJQ45_003869 [Haematococcus lacustris]
MQRPLELCQWGDLEALLPIGVEYQQRYKLVTDRLPKIRSRLHRAAEYRRGIDGQARKTPPCKAIHATGRRVADQLCAVFRYSTQHRPIYLDMHRAVLYTNPLAFNPAKPVFVAAEKRSPVRIQPVNVFDGESLKAVNESLEICRLLDNEDGQPLGGNRVDRTLMEALLKEIDAWDGNLYAFGRAPEGTRGFLAKASDFRVKVAEARARENPDLKEAYRAKIQAVLKQSAEATDKAAVAANQQQLRSLLDRADQLLAKAATSTASTTLAPAGEAFLAGSALSLADALMAAVLYRVNSLGQYQAEIGTRPAVRAYYQRLQARPAWKTTFGPGDSTFVKLYWTLPAVVKATVLGTFGIY